MIMNRGAAGATKDPSDMQFYREAVARWVPLLTTSLRSLRGVEIEDKCYSLSIHYRSSPERSVVTQRIQKAVDNLGAGVRSIGGKFVVNLLPEGAPHKGIALQRLQETLRTNTTIYIGDDTTDEDVFGFDKLGQALCIRVGRSASTKALYYIDSQEEIDDFLDTFLDLQAKQNTQTKEKL
jgi:trehalose 6-phosphate phosphatase